MSDIKRFRQLHGELRLCRLATDPCGDWVRYDDHRAEVERVIADVVKLRIDLNSAQVAANQLRGEVGRLKNAIDHLTSERDAAQAEVERLKEQVGALTVAVEQANEAKADAEAAAAMEEAETDRVMSERDAAQAEVERLTAERDQTANRPKGREVGRVGLDYAYTNAIPPPRPTDEDIWREAFISQLHDRYWASSELADIALAEYRKRWPR